MELAPEHWAALERLHAAGFGLVAFPMHARYVGARKGNCAALLEPSAEGFTIYGQPCYLVSGNLSARVTREGKQWFVWKGTQVEATAERLAELAGFVAELRALLARA